LERTLIEKELLDLPSGATRTEIEGNLADIAVTNRWLGGTSVILRHLSHLVCVPPATQPIRILDMATGGADIPIAIAEWAKRMGIVVHIIAVDSHPTVVEIARRNTRGYPEICVDRQDILNLPYENRSFDFVTVSQAMHHLSSDQAAAALRAANRLSTQGIIVSDLRRSTLGISLASLASHVTPNRLSRHDARVSFQNAFTPGEIKELAEKADIPHYALHQHGPCRLALIVDKRTTIHETAHAYSLLLAA
jgi:SAM-dependent methyltransferase